MIKDLLFDGEQIKGEVGIEIEVEGENLPNVNSKYWRTEHDGSLKAREAYEYVLKQPVERKSVEASLKNLQKYWKADNAIINDSFRAGIHVHVNVRELEVKQVVSYAILYYIFEDILLRWCGEDRVGNHFCLSSKDAEYVLFELEKAIVEGDLRSLHSDDIRYSSLNFKALVQYGSLEFRGMRSTADLKVIQDWVDILIAIKDYAIKVENPSEIIESFSFKGADALAKEVFRDTNLEITKDWEGLMYEGLRRVQAIAFCTDWEEVEQEYIHIPLDLDEDEEIVEEPAVVFDEAVIGGAVVAPRAQPVVAKRPAIIKGELWERMAKINFDLEG